MFVGSAAECIAVSQVVNRDSLAVSLCACCSPYKERETMVLQKQATPVATTD